METLSSARCAKMLMTIIDDEYNDEVYVEYDDDQLVINMKMIPLVKCE